MIYPGSILNCNDNSGALTVKCIGIRNLSKWWGAFAGSLIVISVKTCLKNSTKIQRGGIYYGVVTWVKQNISRFAKSGDFIKFSQNSIVLVAKKNNYLPIGTWVLGPVSKEVRKWLFIKIVLLSSGVF